jgi:hypothetical protein
VPIHAFEHHTNGGIQADVDEIDATHDKLWDEDMSNLAKVLEIFKDSRVSGSDMSSNGVAAEMLWSEMDENASDANSSGGEREEKKVMKKAGNEWYPFASKEVSQAGRGSLNCGGGFTADTSTAEAICWNYDNRPSPQHPFSSPV